MFVDPDDRAYGVCTYFYAGDLTCDDALIDDPSSWVKRDMVERIIEEEGFYDSSSDGPDQLCRWRKLATRCFLDHRLSILLVPACTVGGRYDLMISGRLHILIFAVHGELAFPGHPRCRLIASDPAAPDLNIAILWNACRCFGYNP